VLAWQGEGVVGVWVAAGGLVQSFVLRWECGVRLGQVGWLQQVVAADRQQWMPAGSRVRARVFQTATKAHCRLGWERH
jgi:hypothetical protein